MPKKLRTAAPLCYGASESEGGDGGWTEKTGADDRPADRDTLIRLANSCDRAAARVPTPSAGVSDLDEEDCRTIARILRKLAES